MRFEIEFCEKWNYHPEFDRVSKLIKNKYPDAIVIGNSNPPRTGSFEVSSNNNLLFSKFKLNRFPTKEEIGKW